jgi:hypothetical protein
MQINSIITMNSASTGGTTTGLEQIPLHRTFDNGTARSRLARSRSAPAVLPRKIAAKVAKKTSPTKRMAQSKRLQTHSKPPLAVKRQISDELGADAYHDCVKVLHLSPFGSGFWQSTDLASPTSFNEVQSDIEDAWNSLAELIFSHVNVFSDGTTIEQCECPPPNLNDVDDDELFGLEFLEEDDEENGPFDYSLAGLEMEEV